MFVRLSSFSKWKKHLTLKADIAEQQQIPPYEISTQSLIYVMIRNDLISKDEITISIAKQFLLIIPKEN